MLQREQLTNSPWKSRMMGGERGMQGTPLRPNAKGRRVRKFQLKGLRPWTMGQWLVAWPYATCARSPV